ncbi:uncharacterized protein LOC106773728 isoform X2 [Vigna radiata var. radiata]|uniref:Uncharacterized protein LOC106773728 isoform X2 n=1 Tax=Vigna radiata var. radiata TaxID=3916 RepID=A0A1S3VC71_VIGRR|nr:uncharacterized protein LOC106773728 isoform X2 [Vigna radiata var. radiata]
MISPSPIFISFTLLFITFACATSSLNEIENFKPKGSDGFTVPSHVEEQGEESVKEYLDSVFKNALFGTDSTETLLNKEAYPHSYAIEAESNTQIKDQEPRLILPKHIEEEGPEAIKKYLDDLFSKTLFGTDSIQLDSKTHVKQEGKNKEDADKSFNKVSKLRKEEELVKDDIEVNVNLEIVGDGEYVLKMKRVNPSSNNEDEVERAKHLAQNGAMLLHYGEILQDMGEKLITQSQALLYSVFKMPAPSKFKSHDDQ